MKKIVDVLEWGLNYGLAKLNHYFSISTLERDLREFLDDENIEVKEKEERELSKVFTTTYLLDGQEYLLTFYMHKLVNDTLLFHCVTVDPITRKEEGE